MTHFKHAHLHPAESRLRIMFKLKLTHEHTNSRPDLIKPCQAFSEWRRCLRSGQTRCILSDIWRSYSLAPLLRTSDLGASLAFLVRLSSLSLSERFRDPLDGFNRMSVECDESAGNHPTDWRYIKPNCGARKATSCQRYFQLVQLLSAGSHL